jgi:hypothetical protein
MSLKSEANVDGSAVNIDEAMEFTVLAANRLVGTLGSAANPDKVDRGARQADNRVPLEDDAHGSEDLLDDTSIVGMTNGVATVHFTNVTLILRGM